jgi:hypothetical protein
MPVLYEYTDFHQTNTHLYIFGYTAVDERGKLLRVTRTNARELDVFCDDREYSLNEYHEELKKINEQHSGGLLPICRVRPG